MLIAVVLYPRFTALDLVGPYQVLVGLPDVQVVLVSDQLEPVVDDREVLSISSTARFDDILNPDVVLVPGGAGATEQRENDALHAWLRTVDRTASWMTSVCTGSLILAAAGLLEGRRATTHWLALEVLADYGAVPTEERVVTDDHYITASGVSAGIDMGLRLAALIAGDEAAQCRQLAMEYAPEPPFDAGSRHTAPKAVVDALTRRRSQILTGS